MNLETESARTTRPGRPMQGWYPDGKLVPARTSQDLLCQVIAIGWLERGRPHAKSTCQAALREKLVESVALTYLNGCDPAGLAPGRHVCGFCSSGRVDAIDFGGKSIPLDAHDLYIPGDEGIFCAPALVVHHVLAHDYAPPDAFVNALISCPPIGSSEYWEALADRAEGKLELWARARIGS